MTKNELITTIRDSLVSGNQKEAEDAIDGYSEKIVVEFVVWQSDNNKKWFQGKLKNEDWYSLTFSQRFKKFLNDNK